MGATFTIAPYLSRPFPWYESGEHVMIRGSYSIPDTDTDTDAKPPAERGLRGRITDMIGLSCP